MMHMTHENFKKAYGLTEECFNIPCDPIVNEQAACKMEVINWADSMIRNLETIKNTFRKAPVNNDEEHLKIMKAAATKLVIARNNLSRVLEDA